MDGSTILWHYTILERFELIQRDRYIKPATLLVPKNERPAVWFTRRQDWEGTANKTIFSADAGLRRATFMEMVELSRGLIRIGVNRETAPHDWQTFCQLSGIKPDTARALKKSAKEQGSSCIDWFISFEPVPSSLWIAVEIWDRSKWIPYVENEKVQE